MGMKLWSWVALLSLPLVIGGLVYPGAQTNFRFPSNSDGFVCPVTGEELPCPRCCPWK